MQSKETPNKINAVLTSNAKIIFEDPCLMDKDVTVIGHCTVGAYSYFNKGCIVGDVTIGRYCSVATNVSMGLGEHPIDHISTHPFFFASKNGFLIPDNIGIQRDMSLNKHVPPLIGHDVWIGANAVICRGVKIGIGAIIAAGTVVVKDVMPYSIVGGVPAKHIKYRFDKDIIAVLLASHWWDHPVEHFVGLPANKSIDFVNSLPLIQSPVDYKNFIKTFDSTNQIQQNKSMINWSKIEKFSISINNIKN
ncbi:MAG: CatB-related O-acetyltransferase [Campylobacteraceae bacterium]|jgi:acetyltransferase-like isoleucine patch superfamily enzyme|nr:CatB-related O-acetyltransferase [Campylobacteraceae bacterium]